MEIFPRVDDPFFSEKIAMMEDFGIFKIPAMDKILTKKAFQQTADTLCKFEKTYYQHFVSQYINKRSPYQSLLLYHGLGSGKTCSAITIAETFLVNHRIYDEPTVWVISKKALKKSFEQEIFRMILLTTPEYLREQCTGDMYHQMIPDAEKLAPEKLMLRIKKTIHSRYAFFGYEEFANMITKYETQNILSEKIKDKVIIIDEVHTIRNSDSAIEKKTIKPILAFIKASNKNRLVFLSATPMFNESKEILWLMALLMLNDKTPTTLDPSNMSTIPSFYTADNKPIPETFELMKTLASKYISYVRGSNPLTFAVRIHPSQLNIPISIPMLTTVPTLNFQREVIDANLLNWLASVPDGLVTSTLTGLQLDNFRYLQNNADKVSKPKMRQLNNITYLEKYRTAESKSKPKPKRKSRIVTETEIEEEDDDDEDKKKPVEGREGRNGFLTIMRRNDDGMYEYIDSSHPILDPSKSYLKNHSTKFQTIADLVKESHGIVVIYSNFIWGGIVPLAIMFEHMGFSRYGANNLLKPQHNNIDKPVKFEGIDLPSYVILSGENDKDKGVMGNTKIDDLLMVVNNTEDNKNGKKVKLILMSPVASEGLTFKNVREMHILEPWYHLNTGEQAIGRAIRHCSHSSLPIKERNVSVFLHATVFPNNESETEDIYAYRLSAMKRYQVDSVDKLIKENALDCTLMQHVNYFPKANFHFETALTTSRGTTIPFTYGDGEEKALRCAAADKAVAVELERRAFRDVSYVSFVPTLQLKLQKYLQRMYTNNNLQEFSYNELLEVIHPNKEIAHKTIEASLYPYKLWDTFGLIFHYNKFIITEFKKENLRPIRLQVDNEKESEIADEEDVENGDNLINLFRNAKRHPKHPTREILDIYRDIDSKSWNDFAERLIKTPEEIPQQGIEWVLTILEREGSFILHTELPNMPKVKGKYVGYMNIFAKVTEFKGFVFDSRSNNFEELSPEQILTIQRQRNHYPYTNPSKTKNPATIGMIVPKFYDKGRNKVYRFEFKVGFNNERAGKLGAKCDTMDKNIILRELGIYHKNVDPLQTKTTLCYYLMDHLLQKSLMWIPVEYKPKKIKK
jgi:hypothetical protein